MSSEEREGENNWGKSRCKTGNPTRLRTLKRICYWVVGWKLGPLKGNTHRSRPPKQGGVMGMAGHNTTTCPYHPTFRVVIILR